MSALIKLTLLESHSRVPSMVFSTLVRGSDPACQRPATWEARLCSWGGQHLVGSGRGGRSGRGEGLHWNR